MKKAKKQPGTIDMEAIMESDKKLAIPGDHHKQLARLAGTWTTSTKAWMGPDKPPKEP